MRSRRRRRAKERADSTEGPKKARPVGFESVNLVLLSNSIADRSLSIADWGLLTTKLMHMRACMIVQVVVVVSDVEQ